jgi:glycosyltransferase involved in cell wall biosynthesis
MTTGWEQMNGVRVRRFPVYSRISHLFYAFRPTAKPSRIPGNQYFRTIFNGPIVPGLNRAIRETDFDVLLASSFPLLHMYTSLKAAHQSNHPCILAGGLHPLDEWGYQRPIIYQAIHQADHYIAYTTYEAEYVIQRGMPSDRVTVIGLGVDLPPFQTVDFLQARRRLGLAEDTPLVGFIGQLGGHKGVETLVRAMPIVWQVIPQARLLLAGAKTLYADYLAYLMAEIPETDRGKIILHYNFSNEEKPWLFAALNVLAYPSGYESFGIAFVEAWAVKKPVIGCRRGAVPSVITAGRDGLLVNYRDEAMLAEAIITLLRNPAWALSLGEAGYQKAVRDYNWPEVVRRFRQVYARVMEYHQTNRSR